MPHSLHLLFCRGCLDTGVGTHGLGKEMFPQQVVLSGQHQCLGTAMCWAAAAALYWSNFLEIHFPWNMLFLNHVWGYWCNLLIADCSCLTALLWLLWVLSQSTASSSRGGVRRHPAALCDVAFHGQKSLIYSNRSLRSGGWMPHCRLMCKCILLHQKSHLTYKLNVPCMSGLQSPATSQMHWDVCHPLAI